MKLIGGPFDGAEYTPKVDLPCGRVGFPVRLDGCYGKAVYVLDGDKLIYEKTMDRAAMLRCFEEADRDE